MADRLLGSFVWCELLTSDTAAAESFYKKVVGWTAKPFGPDGSYTVFNNSLGSGVGGVMKLPDAAKQMGAPPHWMMYVGTPNVDETAVRIAQLGGRVHKQPDDIPTRRPFRRRPGPHSARRSPSSLPNRSRFSEPKRGGTGDFSWFELYTPNPEGAWKFYQTLFGWEKTSAMDMGEMGVYQMFGRGGGIPNGGIMKPPPGAPAAWMPYARVKDAKAAAAAAAANGGKIVNGPMEVPGGDWIATGMDPQGAMFSVHSLKPAAQKAAPAQAGQEGRSEEGKESAEEEERCEKGEGQAGEEVEAGEEAKKEEVREACEEEGEESSQAEESGQEKEVDQAWPLQKTLE